MTSMTHKKFSHVLLAAALAGCTAADNLSFDELVTEIDGIVTVTGEGPTRSITYAERAPASAWYMRQFWLLPVRPVLGFVFGQRHERQLGNSVQHVRELLIELPDEAGGDFTANAQCLLRAGWIAALDNSVASRIVGLDVLATCAVRLELPVFACSPEELLAAPNSTEFEAARLIVVAGAPTARKREAWDAAAAKAYTDALARIVATPLIDVSSRLLLAQELAGMMLAEGDDELQAATRQAVTAAMTHAVRALLVEAVRSRDLRWSDFRLCAMQQFRSLGGPQSVPLLLALMSARPAQMARGEDRFDSDPLVRLRLINYCGQLRGELAHREVQLPSVEAWHGIAPVDFLAQTILTEQSYYSKLRVPALTALNLSLERPRLDYDLEWVKAWAEERAAQGRS